VAEPLASLFACKRLLTCMGADVVDQVPWLGVTFATLSLEVANESKLGFADCAVCFLNNVVFMILQLLEVLHVVHCQDGVHKTCLIVG